MSYVDAALAPLRKTGQIKLHGAAAFDINISMHGMRSSADSPAATSE